MKNEQKDFYWLGQTKKDLRRLPIKIQEQFIYDLRVAEIGGKADKAKPMHGFGGAYVMELVEDDNHGTYRAVYTTKFKGAIFILHIFQKKSKSGIATPKKEIDLIKNRLKLAQEIYKGSKK